MASDFSLANQDRGEDARWLRAHQHWSALITSALNKDARVSTTALTFDTHLEQLVGILLYLIEIFER